MRPQAPASEEEEFMQNALMGAYKQTQTVVEASTNKYRAILTEMFKITSQKKYECSLNHSNIREITACAEGMLKMEEQHGNNIQAFIQERTVKITDCITTATETFGKSKNKNEFSRTLDSCVKIFGDGFEKQYISMASSDLNKMKALL